MTWVTKPVPKPRKKSKRGRSSSSLTRKSALKNRTPMKQRNAKRGGSAFPQQRDAKYRRWVWTENQCMLTERITWERFSLADLGLLGNRFLHRCWGGITPAHVGKHQAKGAPDFGVLVPLCKAAHRFYDEHRGEWYGDTGFTEADMARAASGYALKYVEFGGVPHLGAQP